MNRQVRSLCIVIVVATLMAAPPAGAQSAAPESWKVTVVPYVLGAGMNGTTVVAGQEATIDVSFSDILESLEFGAMGLVVARKGNWGVGGDAIWMALGANGTGPGAVGVTANADVNQGAFAFQGLRRLGSSADLFFGARVNTLQVDLGFSGPAAVRSADDTKTWVDPIVGLQWRTPEGGRRWHAQVYTEIGGFGVGSTFSWQVFPTVGVNLADWSSIEFGYRWLDIDYETGEGLKRFKYDVLTQGPVVGVGFRF